MITFDWADFLAPLDPPTVLMALVIGLGFGLSVRAMGHGVIPGHAYWLVMAGVVFFVPLSLERALVGNSGIWERFFATIVLWFLFVGGYEMGLRIPWRR